jgi:inward rectifier potassium channel
MTPKDRIRYLMPPTLLPFVGQRRTSAAQFGAVTVERRGVPAAPFGDAFHFLARASWPVFCLVFAAWYLLLNAIFGALYWSDAGGIENARKGSFFDAFMFSVQTIATIGYGHMAPRSTFANTLVVIESMVAFLGMSLWTGLAFSRFSRPTSHVLFSQRAVITTDDGVQTLMFRVANGRGNRIIDASISVTMLKSELNQEGVAWRRQFTLPLVRDRSPVFALTWTVLHRINAASPLADLAADVKVRMAPQLVVSLVGIDDTFGQPIHATHYYDAPNILSGYRFVDMASTGADGRLILDFGLFDAVEHDGSVRNSAHSTQQAKDLVAL